MRNVSFLVVLLLASTAHAVPLLLNQQGRILDSTSHPLTGSYATVFSIWDDETMGNLVWSETLTVTFADGYFSVVLGQTIPIDEGVLDNLEVWLGLSLGGEELLPRQRLVSVPYAVMSGTAQNVLGGVVNASRISIGSTPVIDGTGAWVGPTAGLVGPTGPQGLQGPTGETGPIGPQGALGATGPLGPQGVPGATGPLGPQGVPGATGPLGPQGVPGATGPLGPQGPTGPAGPTDPTQFIQNQTSVAQAASFRTSGTGQLQTLTVNGNLTVGGRVTLGIYVQSCAPTTAPYDCACNPGDFAVGGGGFAYQGGGNVLRESDPTPGNANAWRVTCAVINGASSSFDNKCQGAYAVCLAHAQ